MPTRMFNIMKERVGGRVRSLQLNDQEILELAARIFNLAEYYNPAQWATINFPIVVRTVGILTPTMEVLKNNILAPRWAVNDLHLCEVQELPASWLEASSVYCYIHIVTGAQDASNRYVKFEVEYTWANFNSAVPATTTLTSAELLIPANTADRTHLVFSIGSFTPSGGKVGGHCWVRLKRVAATGTAPSVDPFCTMVKMYVQVDSMGSWSMTTKI